jgi:hypothetical protein
MARARPVERELAARVPAAYPRVPFPLSACPQSSEALHRLACEALAPKVHPPLESFTEPRGRQGSTANLESFPTFVSDARLRLRSQRPPSLRLKPRETDGNRGLGHVRLQQE